MSKVSKPTKKLGTRTDPWWPLGLALVFPFALLVFLWWLL